MRAAYQGGMDMPWSLGDGFLTLAVLAIIVGILMLVERARTKP
jgi:hypothetical protein